TPKITTRWLTPICGAARPAPFFAAMVSFMSSTSARSSGVASFSTGFARSRSTGWPMRSTSRTAMALLHLRDDHAHLRHALLHHLGDVVERDRARALAAPGRGVHDDGEGRVAQAQLAGEGGFGHAGHADHGRAVALQPIELRLGLQ